MPSLISLIESLVTSFRYSGEADPAEIETCEKLAQDFKNAHAPIVEKHGKAAAAKRAVENKAAALQLAEWQRLVDSTRRAEMAVAQMQSGGKAQILNSFRSGVKTSSPKPATAPTKAPTAPPKPVESAMRHLSNKELCIAAGNAHGKFSKREIQAARAELERRQLQATPLDHLARIYGYSSTTPEEKAAIVAELERRNATIDRYGRISQSLKK
jgi:hypothetical protein